MKSVYFFIAICLIGCAPIKPSINNQYRVTAFAKDKVFKKHVQTSILISETQATSGYNTEQMLYINKPYQLNSFVKSAWISQPSGMITPLILQSMQASNYFHAVASGPDVDKTDYRLDTELLSFQQNFLMKPSVFEYSIQATLTHIADARIVTTHTFTYQTPCPANTPYGGVLAANNTLNKFTSDLRKYVIRSIQLDK
jgi:cholesterol transport system auxiliary component